MADDSTAEDDEERAPDEEEGTQPQNQYGGGDENIDAVEQTERMQDDEDEGDEE